jgi:hypothetical protein
MAVRVYSCDSSDVQALKALLSYDPYLDPKLIPSSSEKDDKALAKMDEGEKKKYYEEQANVKENIRMLKEDPMMNIIFARQDYVLKDGISLGLDRNKSYLYLKADDSFFGLAEKKLKENVKSAERVEEDTERKIIESIDSEREAAEQGLGSIFG